MAPPCRRPERRRFVRVLLSRGPKYEPGPRTFHPWSRPRVHTPDAPPAFLVTPERKRIRDRGKVRHDVRFARIGAPLVAHTASITVDLNSVTSRLRHPRPRETDCTRMIGKHRLVARRNQCRSREIRRCGAEPGMTQRTRIQQEQYRENRAAPSHSAAIIASRH